MLAIDSTGEDTFAGGRGEQLRGPRAGARLDANENGHGGRWLSINAACEILGVDKSTLRRWSDNGRVPVFRTPGGHRRYSEDDLNAFLSGDLVEPRAVSRRELAAITRDEFERSQLPVASDSYLGLPLSDDWVAELSRACEGMIDTCIRYASGRGNPDQHLAQAREIAQCYGRCTARAQLDTREAIEAFLRFRRPLFDALGRYVEKQNLSARRSCRMVGKLNTCLDVMLTALVEAHEAHTKG